MFRTAQVGRNNNKMLEKIILTFVCVSSGLAVAAGYEPLFHVNSRTIFRPTSAGGYFGYAVLLKEGNTSEVLVGAPKAAGARTAGGRPGALYRCAPALAQGPSDVTCTPHALPSLHESSQRHLATYFVDDMWLGASMAAVTEDTLLVCAPRWTTPYGSRHLLANGLCFVLSKDNTIAIVPLSGGSQAFLTDGKRKEYGDYGTHLNFYAYAQAGISVKMSEDRSSLLLGAPGLLQWSGGVVQYQLSDRKDTKKNLHMRPVTNPYFTLDLHPDDYFGYSVESGVFESSGETLYVGGAPRGAGGLGQVLIFKPSVSQNASLTIMGRLEGPQLGAYFGSSLLCLDLDGDGRADVLVGAPNYVQPHDKFSYDQGAVYVYLTKPKDSGFTLRAAGSVQGSGAVGARFGSALGALGDADGDGYPEVAVGAPWEEDGRGAVYVYGAHAHGLRTAYVQRISPSGARAFGIAISRGLDVDRNGCNDLAVGAHVSDETYLFRCVPTITMKTSIMVPGALEQPQNITNFTALFCTNVAPATGWPMVRLELKATISVDKREGRANIIGDSEYKISSSPAFQSCEQRTVLIKSHSDLSKPISLDFEVTPERGDSSLFPLSKARLSHNSVTYSLFHIQLTNDCGEDLICQPELTVQLKGLDSSPYIPGSGDRVGVIATLVNAGEPAYGAVVNFSLPAAPMRIPSSCEMFASNMTCKAPSPLYRGENATYVIEVAYVQKDVKEEELNFTAEIYQPLNRANKTQIMQTHTIKVLPTANITIKGKALPNVTLHISRDQFSAGDLIKFVHYFEITNFGPSDWPYLNAEFKLADWVSLPSGIQGCMGIAQELNCSFDIPARVSSPIALPFIFDLKKNGDKLEETGVYEATTVLILKQYNMNATLTTRLVLRAAPPLWSLVVGGVAGLLLLAAIVYACYKCGFFTRKRPQDTQEEEQIIEKDTSREGSVENDRGPGREGQPD